MDTMRRKTIEDEKKKMAEALENMKNGSLGRCYPKVAMINTYNDFLTFKKVKGFEKLEEGSELWIAWGPLCKLVGLELDILYETNGLRREQKTTTDHEILIFFEED